MTEQQIIALIREEIEKYEQQQQNMEREGMAEHTSEQKIYLNLSRSYRDKKIALQDLLLKIVGQQ